MIEMKPIVAYLIIIVFMIICFWKTCKWIFGVEQVVDGRTYGQLLMFERQAWNSIPLPDRFWLKFMSAILPSVFFKLKIVEDEKIGDKK